METYQKGQNILIKKEKYRTFFTILFKWLTLGSITGILIGSATAFLINTIDFFTNTRESNPWMISLLPAGGIIIGYIYKNFGKNSAKGTNLILEHIQKDKTDFPVRMGLIVYIGSFITHLFGGSSGREGAALQMGGSIAEAVARVFKISKADRKILLMSGISGGFGSAFGTPLAGTVFGMEIVALGQLRYEAIIPCFVSSFVGHMVTSAWGVVHEHHVIKKLPELNASTVIKIVFASILFSLISVLYSELRHNIKKYSNRYFKNPMLRRAIGGIIIVLLFYMIGSTDYLGRGLPMFERSFKGTVPPLAFFAKLVFTAITMGFGFRGGEAIPLFFIGATLGNTLAPLMNFHVSFLAALETVAVFCGAGNTPIACFLLGVEMFDVNLFINDRCNILSKRILIIVPYNLHTIKRQDYYIL